MIGATTNVSGNLVNLGLTNGWITNPNANGCSGCKVGSVNANANATAFLQRNYVTNLFATPTSLGTAAPSGYQGPGTLGPSVPVSTVTISDPTTGGTFALMDDGITNTFNGPNNLWAGQSSSIEVPIGVFGVSKVWTMMNDYWGAGATTTITFNYGSTKNTVDIGSYSFSLAGATALRDAVDCDGLSGPIINPPSAGPAPTCTVYAQGNGLNSAMYTSTYTNSTLGSAANNPYFGTNGQVNLDAQFFNLRSNNIGVRPNNPNYLNEWLVSITITNTAGGNPISKTALSAITVEQVPEPGTVFLFVSGLGALGLARFRRRKA